MKAALKSPFSFLFPPFKHTQQPDRPTSESPHIYLLRTPKFTSQATRSTAAMSYFDKQVVGAEVVHLEPPRNPSHNSTLTKVESTSSSTLHPPSDCDAASRDDYTPSSDHPFSPFYSHPTTRTSLEQKKSESRVRFQLYEHDLESGSRVTQNTQKETAQLYHTNDAVWPSGNKQHEAAPKRLSKKQKFWIKFLIAILVIGAITGLGIGITKAVGGGVFRTTSNSSAPIGDNKH